MRHLLRRPHPLRALAALLCAGAALAGATSAQAATTARSGATGCPDQSLSHPFVRWLDPAGYVPLQNGSLEKTDGWSLSGGARLVAGNEPFYVGSTGDRTSLSLPAGSSATSPPMCITLLHPTLRFFALNGGAGSVLRVDAIVRLAGIRLSLPIGVVLAGSSWQPTLPMPFLTNLLAPVSGTVSFRFTPLGPSSGWRIDDVYLDPYKSA
ncbi:MAG TPA: hypothetical protein VH760_09490 [Gaiellaceae bacterium]